MPEVVAARPGRLQDFAVGVASNLLSAAVIYLVGLAAGVIKGKESGKAAPVAVAIVVAAVAVVPIFYVQARMAMERDRSARRRYMGLYIGLSYLAVGGVVAVVFLLHRYYSWHTVAWMTAAIFYACAIPGSTWGVLKRRQRGLPSSNSEEGQTRSPA